MCVLVECKVQSPVGSLINCVEVCNMTAAHVHVALIQHDYSYREKRHKPVSPAQYKKEKLHLLSLLILIRILKLVAEFEVTILN